MRHFIFESVLGMVYFARLVSGDDWILSIWDIVFAIPIVFLVTGTVYLVFWMMCFAFRMVYLL